METTSAVREEATRQLRHLALGQNLLGQEFSTLRHLAFADFLTKLRILRAIWMQNTAQAWPGVHFDQYEASYQA